MRKFLTSRPVLGTGAVVAILLMAGLLYFGSMPVVIYCFYFEMSPATQRRCDWFYSPAAQRPAKVAAALSRGRRLPRGGRSLRPTDSQLPDKLPEFAKHPGCSIF